MIILILCSKYCVNHVNSHLVLYYTESPRLIAIIKMWDNKNKGRLNFEISKVNFQWSPRSGNILLFRESRATDGRFHVRNKACASTLTRISVCTLSSVVVTNLSVCLFVCQQVACDVVIVYTLDRSRRAMSVSQSIGQSRSDPWSLHSWNPYYIPFNFFTLTSFTLFPAPLSQSLAISTLFSLYFFFSLHNPEDFFIPYIYIRSYMCI